MGVGENMRRLRMRKGILQKDLARLLNVSQNAVCLYENGKREPNIRSLVKMCDFFDVSLDYLVGRIPASREGENVYADGVCVIRGKAYALYGLDEKGGE